MDATNKQCVGLFALDHITHTGANTAALSLTKTVYFLYDKTGFVANQWLHTNCVEEEIRQAVIKRVSWFIHPC